MAHPVQEDPEQLIGVELPDPWEDPEQADWPMNPEGGASEDGLGTGAASGGPDRATE